MEEVAKRKLPLWMSSSVAATINTTVVQSEPKAERSTEKNAFLDHESSEVVGSCVLTELELRRRQGKKINQEAEGISSAIEVHEKGNNRSGGRNLKKKRKESSLRYESSEEADTLSSNEDDGELTVEDLMTIAQEYVIRDEKMGQQQLSSKIDDMKRNLFAPPQSNKGLPIFPEEETVPVVHNYSAKTGDPAQDMLDLFLGPLLKKTKLEDTRSKAVELDRTCSRDANEQVPSSSIAVTDLVLPTKKKSSLKDKAAVFLD